MWSDYIMDLLLMLQAYGIELTPNSDAWAFDYNGNGIIDITDLLTHLSQQPSTQCSTLHTPSR